MRRRSSGRPCVSVYARLTCCHISSPCGVASSSSSANRYPMWLCSVQARVRPGVDAEAFLILSPSAYHSSLAFHWHPRQDATDHAAAAPAMRNGSQSLQHNWCVAVNSCSAKKRCEARLLMSSAIHGQWHTSYWWAPRIGCMKGTAYSCRKGHASMVPAQTNLQLERLEPEALAGRRSVMPIQVHAGGGGA